MMDHIKAVQKMQDYIRLHYQDENFSVDTVCSQTGYSRRHADRLFKEYLGKTLQEYIKAVCLTQSADTLLNTNTSVLEVALNSHFESHEGFTRSFCRRFSLTPSEYRNRKTAIPLFVQYPISHYYALLKHKEEPIMNNEQNLCMISPVKRAKRKLIFLPSRNAQDYFSYCEEVGCDWEGLLNSIPEKLEPAALMELPDFLVENGFSKTAAGIEVPSDYDKPLPEQYKIAELEECTMLYFQGEPYENEEDFCTAIEKVYTAVEKYNASAFGYRLAYDVAPSFNFGADTSTGAKIAVPALPVS